MMKQQFENYTPADFEVWRTLFVRQKENLQSKACEVYLDALNDLKSVLNSENIPRFEELNQLLYQQTGWTIEVVPGLIPVEDFFELLAQKKFCSSTWLRTMDQLDYLEEPDMFHDVFGHIPLFMNEAYGNFAQKMGLVGVQFKDSPEILIELQRIYWFTIEFGLIKGATGPEIYGAGIVSSFGETNTIGKKEVEVLSFNLEEIMQTDFCNSEMQGLYFELDSFQELYQAFEMYAEGLLLQLASK